MFFRFVWKPDRQFIGFFFFCRIDDLYVFLKMSLKGPYSWGSKNALFCIRTQWIYHAPGNAPRNSNRNRPPGEKEFDMFFWLHLNAFVVFERFRTYENRCKTKIGMTVSMFFWFRTYENRCKTKIGMAFSMLFYSGSTFFELRLTSDRRFSSWFCCSIWMHILIRIENIKWWNQIADYELKATNEFGQERYVSFVFIVFWRIRPYKKWVRRFQPLHK